MKIKQILAAMLAALLAFPMASCTACSNDSNSQSSGSTAPSGQIEVNITQSRADISDALQKAADTYMKANPTVKINLDPVDAQQPYGDTLRAKMESGAQPVIFQVSGPQGMEDWSAKLEDLSDQPWVANAVEGTLLAVTRDDKVYGMPYGIEGYGLVYNRAIFETAGIPTEDLKTFDDIENAMKILKQKIDGGELKEKYPALEAVFELPAKETWTTGLHALNLALTNEFEGPTEAYEAQTVQFTHAESLRRLLDMQAAYTKYAGDLGQLNTVDYEAQVGGGLATERVAMVQQGNWIYNEVAAVNADVARNLDLLPLPLKDVKEDSIPVGVPMYWCINSESSRDQKTAAKNFLNWLYQSEEGKRIVVEELRCIPAFTNYEGLEPADPLGKAVKRYAEEGRTMPWVFTSFPTAWGQDTFGMNLQKYFAGEMKWEDLLTDARSKWEEARGYVPDMTASDSSMAGSSTAGSSMASSVMESSRMESSAASPAA